MDSNIGRTHDAKGRSTGKLKHFGGTAKRWKFEGGFIGEPQSLLESPSYAALTFPALRILHALKLEHVRHGGTANGRLLAPHAQLRALGISPRNVKPALVLLEALGVIRTTSDGSRLGGRPNAATYALTWLPTCDGQWPSEDYKRVTAEDARNALRDASNNPRKQKAAFPRERGPRSQGNVTAAKSAPTTFTRERGATLTRERTLYIQGGMGPGEPQNPSFSLQSTKRPQLGPDDAGVEGLADALARVA